MLNFMQKNWNSEHIAEAVSVEAELQTFAELKSAGSEYQTSSIVYLL